MNCLHNREIFFLTCKEGASTFTGIYFGGIFEVEIMWKSQHTISAPAVLKTTATEPITVGAQLCTFVLIFHIWDSLLARSANNYAWNLPESFEV